MSGASNGGRSEGLSPDEAFAKVGNDARIQILQTLAESEPLTFSELYDAVDIDDSGNFTYHLDKLTGHFVRESNGEYMLREPGGIIVQAILSGVVTAASGFEPTRLEAGCPYCGQPVEVSCTDERVLVRCTACIGTYAGGETDARFLEAHPHGTIAIFRLPPAGLKNRTAMQVLDVALARTHLELLSLAHGICPRCSARIDHSLQVCEDHESVDGMCDTCNRRRSIYVDYECKNCIRVEENIPAGLHLIKEPGLMSFISGHGINPVIPSWNELDAVVGYDEELTAVDPVRAKFTYEIEDDALALMVKDNLDNAEIWR